MQEISVEQLKERQGVPLIDVREEDEFAAGRVPGAINVPMSQLGERMGELPQEFDVICHLGGRSARVAAALAPHGFEATNVSGGTDAWIAAGYEVEL